MSPWQVFSLIFIIFYLTMKHLNNILASVVLTIIYGALMEITAKVSLRLFTNLLINLLSSICTYGITQIQLAKLTNNTVKLSMMKIQMKNWKKSMLIST